ncbi:MAG: hypothetical protein ACXAD7_10530 [Candidatus Kariarchaeaceae archaeon]
MLQDRIPWRLPQANFTTVVATFVFCTMSNPKPILDELLKWTSSGSKMILFEYITPKNSILKLITKIINPLTYKLFGVNFNREATHSYLNQNWELIRITPVVTDWLIVVEIKRK